ncbi:MAG: hypothetical protein WCG03_00815 [Kiritimatiellales bacterium]
MKFFWWFIPVVLVALIFVPTFSGKVIAPLDDFGFYAPWSTGDTAEVDVHNHFAMDFPEVFLGERVFAWQSFRDEGRLGWSDLTFSGTAQYANTMDLYFDWSVQLLWFLEFWDAWHWGLFGQLVLAALGMLVLLRSRGVSRLASVLGAVCYSMNSMFFTWMFHCWMLGAFCWLPWVIWSFYALREKKKAGVLAPIFLCFGFFGGHLQFAAFYIISLGSLFFWWLIEDWRDSPKKGFQSLVGFGLLGLLAVGLAAVMFVPCVKAYLMTLDAGLKRGGIGYPEGVWQPLKNLLLYPLYLFPPLLGRPQALDWAKGFSSDLFNIPFIGSLPLIFAFLYGMRILSGKEKDRGPLIFMVLGLLLPLTPLVGPLYQRLFILFIFGAAWAVARAADSAAVAGSPKTATWLWRIFLMASLIWSAMSVGIQVFQLRLQHRLFGLFGSSIANHRFALFEGWWRDRVFQAVVDLKIWSPEMAVSWALFGAAVYLYYRHAHKRLSHKMLLVGLIMTSVCQLYWFNKNWVVYADKPQQTVPTFDGQDFLQKNIEPWNRVATVQREGRPKLFPLNTLGLYNIAHYHGYGSIVPPGIQKNLPAYCSAKEMDAAQFGRWGVTHAIGFFDESGLGEGWTLVGREGQVSLFTNTLSRARYEAISRSETVPLTPETHQMNYRRLLLPEHTDAVHIMENWGQGWQFRVNQAAWAPVIKTENYTMRAVLDRPAELGDIFEMQYCPQALRVGRVISVSSLGVYILFSVLYLKLRERNL